MAGSLKCKGYLSRRRVGRVAKAWSDKLTLYGESTGYQIIGLESASVVVPSRIHSWTSGASGRRHPQALGVLSITSVTSIAFSRSAFFARLVFQASITDKP